MKKTFVVIGFALLSVAALGQANPAAPPSPITYSQAVANEQKLFAADQ